MRLNAGMPWLATCPHETVDVLESELHDLGVQNQSKLYRGIIFECELETAYRAHLLLRTASRIQRVVARFNVTDIDSLQAELRKIEWSQWLRSQRPFQVMAALTDEKAQALGEEAIVSVVVQSIEQCEFKSGAPKFNSDADNPITIVLFIRDGNCVLGIDTAGRALHKRGWRTNGHPAVLKETLAASILLLAGYTGDEPLMEPMCGSGTIAIEAAYIALQKAPLIHRGKDDFALEHLAGFDRPLWRRVSDQLRAAKKSELPAPIYASDIDGKYVEVARAAALRARVEKYISFSVGRFQDIEPPAQSGLLVMNLPYGERIGGDTVRALYRDVGETIKQRYPGWRAALLVPQEAPENAFGLAVMKKFTLRNGALPVKLLMVGEQPKSRR
jgi:putative N6-adenine-specific DNA methylase